MSNTTEMDKAAPATGLAALYRRAGRLVARLAHPDLALLVTRIAVAVPFWKSGVLKWDGFLQLAPVAPLLFENEFKLHLPGGPYDFPFPHAMAFGAGLGEIILPVLLVLGIFSRLAAVGLLAMTLIIQLTVPTGWPVHLTWAAMALAIAAFGPGRVSADHMTGLDRR